MNSIQNVIIDEQPLVNQAEASYEKPEKNSTIRKGREKK
jgi:hypothetical protein